MVIFSNFRVGTAVAADNMAAEAVGAAGVGVANIAAAGRIPGVADMFAAPAAVGSKAAVGVVGDRFVVVVGQRRVGHRLGAVDNYKTAVLLAARTFVVEGVPFLYTLGVRLRLFYFLFF